MKEEYSWPIPTEPEYVYAVLTVKVNAIKQVIKVLQHNGIELLYIHDF